MSILDDQFWGGFLGVEPGALTTPGVSFGEHVGLRGYRGFWCFRRLESLVVSAPMLWTPRLRDIAAGQLPDALVSADFWAEALSGDFDLAIGPAFQGCLDPAKFKPRAHPAVRALGDFDEAAVQQFRAACGSDWEMMPDEATLWRHAFFEDDVITSMAAFRSWSDTAGDPCVITLPGMRSQGCGAAVTSAVVAAALANAKLLLYQTLESNHAAVRIALALGFERYATHLAVRLSSDSPHG